MQFMNKAVALLVLTTLIAGCQSFNAYDSQANRDAPGLACVIYGGQEPIDAQEINSIRYLSTLGDSTCTMILGKLYESGRGLPQDIAKAKALYLSVAGKDPFAYARLGRMAEEGVGGPPNLVEARQFYQRAVTMPLNGDVEAKLAGFMEEGIGGPQDFEGALTHYLNAPGFVGDASWQGMERMRAKGLTLTSEQQQRYNDRFIDTVQYGFRKKIEAIQKVLAKENTPIPAGKQVRLQLEYTLGSLVPGLSLVESSGVSAIDQTVMEGFSDYRFPADPIMPPGLKSFKLIAVVRPGAKDTLASKKD
jgi:hypothetical protein